MTAPRFSFLSKLSQIVLCFLVSGSVSQLQADETAAQHLNLLSAPKLQTDDALQKTISLEVKRKTLDYVIEQIGALGGMVLSVSKDVDARRTLTANIIELPTWQVMEQLGQIYDLRWIKQADGSYTAQNNDFTETERTLKKFGPSIDRHPGVSDEILYSQQKKLVAKELLDKYGAKLRTKEGLSYTELPVEMQTSLRQVMEPIARLDLIAAYGKVIRVKVDDLALRFQASLKLNVEKTQTQLVHADLSIVSSKLPLPAPLMRDGFSFAKDLNGVLTQAQAETQAKP